MGCLIATLERKGGMSVSVSRKGDMTCKLTLICSTGIKGLTVITYNHVAIINNGVVVGYK